MANNLLRINEAVRVTGISRNTLYRYMRNGKLSYTEKDGVRYLDRHEINKITPTDLAQQDLFSDKSDTPQLHLGDAKAIKELTQEVAALRTTITLLTSALSDIVTVVSKLQTRPVPSQTRQIQASVSDNERRTLEAQRKVWAALEQHKANGGKLPSIKVMAEEIGMDRGTFSKHKKTWELQQSDVSV
jgi:transcriptional regulator of acetoin/glycerol metabolism